MNIPVLIALCMARANSTPSPGAGPTGAPSDVSVTYYAGTKRKVIWKNTDATAYSRVYRLVSGVWVFLRQVDPGVTSYETGLTTGTSFGVSHYKNGQESDISDGVL